jgi:hypothetical protein
VAVQASGGARFAAMKERQADAHDRMVIPAHEITNGQERFLAMKARQAELRDATFVPWSAGIAGVHSSRTSSSGRPNCAKWAGERRGERKVQRSVVIFGLTATR